MSDNLFYAAAISLPRQSSYLCLHWHNTKARCKWMENDTQIYAEVLNAVRTGERFGSRALDIDFGDQPGDALSLLPCYLTISYDRSQKPNFRVVTKAQHYIKEVEAVGSDEVRAILINKDRQRLEFPQNVLDAVTALTGEPFTQEDADTLEGRSNPHLVRAMAENYQPGPGVDLKLVVVPAGPEVRLTRNSQGEFIREIARTWA